MNVTLHIAHSDEEQWPATAWFIAGWHAAGWLEEMAGWGVPLAGMRLFALPRGPADLQPAGALVVPPAGMALVSTGRARPWGCAAKRLYLPVEARIEPPVTDAELAALLDAEQTYVWHPAVGLVAFGPEHSLRVEDLLITPSRNEAAWDTAVPGVALNARLAAIEPDQPLDLAAMIREARDDIGSRPPTLDELPPSPAEPSGNPAAQLGGALGRGLAKAVAWLTSQVPHTGSQRTWVNDLEDWAQRQLRRAAESLETARHRELARLLKLLTDDPDRGLRYALPVGGDAHRGLAPPGVRLPPRDVNFNLGRLGGGRPADYWGMPPDYRARLLNRYRELANREIALGRHRRAAYILAELLGDVSSAAATLADGGHFREAAALYEERLRNPLAAAHCLERGGLWSEAIALYERLGNYERVGDLCRQLEQPERAESAYRLAVDGRLKTGDFLAAATLLEQKLDAPQEALERLLDGWRGSKQRARCLDEAYRLLARMADHGRARRQVAQLREAVAPGDHLLLAQGLAQVAVSYPDALVCRAAADAVRLVAAERLDERPAADETQALVTAVGQLVPQDRLLARDGRRFAASRLPKSKPPASPRRPSAPCPLVREFQLPPAEWRTAVSIGPCYFAAGYQGDRDWIVVAGSWDGESLSVVGPRRSKAWVLLRRPLLMTAHADGRPTAILCPDGEPLEQHQTYPQMTWLPSVTSVGSHPGLSATTLALAYSNQGVLHCVQDDGTVVLVRSFGLTGTLLGTQRLDPAICPSGEDFLQPVPFFVRGSDRFLAFGELVYVVAGGRVEPLWDSGFLQIRSLTGSPPHTRTRIIAGCERGGVIVWGDRPGAAFKTFATELDSPAIGLTRGGWLVAASREETQLYDTHNSRRFAVGATLATGGDGVKADPVAVLATRNASEFALLLSDGRLLIHKSPERE